MMLMYFKFFLDFDSFLFKQWSCHQRTGLVGICAFCCVLAIISEFLSYLTVYLQQKSTVNPLHYGLAEGDSDSHPETVRPLLIPPSLASYRSRKIQLHVAQTFVRMSRLLIGYLTMLAVMTYNAYIAIAVLVGSLVGYFIFGALRVHLVARQRERLAAGSDNTSLNNEPCPPLGDFEPHHQSSDGF